MDSNLFLDNGSDRLGWILTIASGLACTAGASVVFWDICLQKCFPNRHVSIEGSSTFLVMSLALGAGVMLVTALYNLLPESRKLFEESLWADYAGFALMIFFFIGVLFCICLNQIVHYFMAENIVHCLDDESLPCNPPQEHLCDQNFAIGDGFHSIGRKTGRRLSHYVNQEHAARETTPLISQDSSTPTHSASMSAGSSKCVVGVCAGYTEPCSGSTCSGHVQQKRRNSYSRTQIQEVQCASLNHNLLDHDLQHHHHITSHRSQMLKIGIQTSIALSLHKFPEGFITYMSSHHSKSLGIALFLAIGLHNISEGITLTLPLYMATGSRWKAFIFATLLGGLSQPIGAIVAYFVAKYEPGQVIVDKTLYGVIWAVSSGLMCYVAIFSMLSQAFKRDKTDGTHVAIPFFLGVAVIGFSSALL